MNRYYDPAKTTPLTARGQDAEEAAVNFVPVETPKYKTQELVEAFAENIFGSIPDPQIVMRCSACGQEANGDELFCIMCGEFIEESEITASLAPTCGECGTTLSADDIFCLACGAAV
ncbi:MAG: zinc ribbon domain-containing protein [Acidobacteriota bacterium]